MHKWVQPLNPPALISTLLLFVLLAGCAPVPQNCPIQVPDIYDGAADFAENDQLPFQFPLYTADGAIPTVSAPFCANGQSSPSAPREYHAAEDYAGPAGAPVYALADGTVSFTGPMGGYGWLIIIDHPQANLYSLYGHLSPSRWRVESGTVTKGELIGYLGDSDENGGSAKKPLRTHLHFGIRAGQRADYSGMGEWRWQAGWIKYCPTDLNWLKPSAIISAQLIPLEGFDNPTGTFLEIWWIEMLFGAIYTIGSGFMLLFAYRRKNPRFAIIYNLIIMVVAAFFFRRKGIWLSNALFAMAGVVLVMGLALLWRRRRNTNG